MAEVIYLNESDEIGVFLQRKNTSTGAMEPASGLTTLSVRYAATQHGSAIDASLSVLMAERSASPGSYYGTIPGAAKAAHLTVDQAVYVRITDGAAIDDERQVTVRQVRDSIPTTQPSTGAVTIVTPPPPPPPPPDTSDTTPTTVVVGPSNVALVIGATKPMSVSIRNAEGANLGQSPTSWSSSDTGIATVDGSGVVTAVAIGTVSILAHYNAIPSNSATVAVTAVVTGDVTAVTLPQTFLTTTVASTPSTGRTVNVSTQAQLQAALDAAIPGDQIKIAAGAIINAATTGWALDGLRAGGNTGEYITITSAGSLPPEGTRMTPTLAAFYNIPRLKGVPFSGAIAGAPVLEIRNAANKVRIIGLEICWGSSVTNAQAYQLINTGTGQETSTGQLVSNVIVDRVYAHGHSTCDARHAIGTHALGDSVIDSYVDEIHSAQSDAKGVWGWNSVGPHKIKNTYVAASGECFGYGGVDPRIAGVIPTDIECRGNYFTKPVTSKSDGWLTKNLVEFKSGFRALIEGNVFENSIAADQNYALVFWSVNQSGTHNAAETSHITVRKNEFRNCAGMMQITQGFDPGTGTFVPAHHIAVSHNAGHGLDTAATRYRGASNVGILVGPNVADVSIEHNTIPMQSDSVSIIELGDAASSSYNLRLTIKNNLGMGGVYPLFLSSANGALFNTLTNNTGVFSGNVIAGPNAAGSASQYAYPGNNQYPSDPALLQLVGGTSAALSASSALSSLALISGSTYAGTATDGTDPGADMSAVASAVATAVSGVT